MKIPLHVKIRKSLRSLLYSLLSKNKKSQFTQDKINKHEINRIVIIRPNYRIGNIIFLTPLINELLKELPNAQIDIIVGMKLAGNLLEPLENVNKVTDIPRKLLSHPLKLYNFIKEQRKTKYDLAINIAPASVSSQIVTLFVNAKYKASFENDKNFTPLTHSIIREGLYTHAGSQALEFLKLFTNNLPKENLQLDIKLSQEELQQAKDELKKLLHISNTPSTNKTIALFRNARFDKKISDEWWNEWHKELLQIESDITVIDIMSPDILHKLNSECLEYSNKNLRALGAFFYVCDMYVSADTGPLHLSCASGAKTVALFNKTNMKMYGTLGDKNSTIDINTLTPKDVSMLCYEHLLKKV